MDFSIMSTAKAMGEHRINWGRNTLLDLHYTDDLSILDKNVSKINEFLEVLRVQGEELV